MAGAGSFAAGSSPAGADPPATAPPPRNVSYFGAILYDGASGDYPLDANGRYQSLHPVSQRVALKLLVRLGAHADFKKIRRGPPDQRAADAKRIVKDTLKDDVAAGDIRHVRTDVDASSPNATITAVYFVNLRDNTKPVATPDNVTIKH